MRRTIWFPAEACLPDAAEVLRTVGATGASAGLVPRALTLFTKLARPAGVWAEIGPGEFAPVFAGSGENAPRAPLGGIFPRAERLALFAVTLGPGPNAEIARLFEERDYPLGYLLDAVASAGTERLAGLVQRDCEEVFAGPSAARAGGVMMRYSPGYCGWHVTAQRPLFAFLAPGEAGITLRESCLMEPLKSVSGVFVLGPAAIHRFEDDFEFCSECPTRGCRERRAAATAKE